MNAVEMHYTVAEVALLLRLHPKTVIRKMKAMEFGQAYNLGTEQRPDWRLPACGINGYLERHRLFSEPGIAARSVGELRRKAARKEESG